MNSLNPLTAVGSAVLGAVNTWSVESQQGARRNALLANTDLAARRAERQDVDAFLASLHAEPPAVPLPTVAHR